MTKIIYFDVQDDEKEFLIKNNEGKYDYHLTTNSLNNIIEVKEEYKDAEIISVFTNSRVSNDVLAQFSNLKLIALRSVGFNVLQSLQSGCCLMFAEKLQNLILIIKRCTLNHRRLSVRSLAAKQSAL